VIDVLGFVELRVEAERLADLEEAGDGALDKALTSVLDQIKLGAPGAIAATKTLMRRARLEDPASLVADAAAEFAKAARGPEGAEGMTAFIEKRKPNWAL
jgi:isohexenylglutaconyl-CoA hydratase